MGFEPTTLCSLGEHSTNWATRYWQWGSPSELVLWCSNRCGLCICSSVMYKTFLSFLHSLILLHTALAWDRLCTWRGRVHDIACVLFSPDKVGFASTTISNIDARFAHLKGITYCAFHVNCCLTLSYRNSVLWVHTCFSILYLIITGVFMIKFSLKLGKFQQDMVHNVHTYTSSSQLHVSKSSEFASTYVYKCNIHEEDKAQFMRIL